MYIKEQNSQIVTLLKEKVVSQPTEFSDELPVELPLSEQKDLNCLEAFIQDKENFKSLVCD